MRKSWWAIVLVAGPAAVLAQSTSTGLPALKEELAAEVGAREAADTIIDARLGNEEARAAIAEQDLRTQLQQQIDSSGTALTAEQSARAAADGELRGVIGSEITSRAQADQKLTADIGVESAARSSAIAALQTQNAQQVGALATEVRSSIALEAADRKAFDDASVASLHAEVQRLMLEVKTLTTAVSDAKTALANAGALPAPSFRAGVISAACSSPELESAVLSAHQRVATTIDLATRAAIIRESSYLTRFPPNASTISSVTTRITAVAASGSTTDTAAGALMMAIEDAAAQLNDMASELENLVAQLQELEDELSEVVSDRPTSPNDGDPLSSATQAELSVTLPAFRSALVAICCAPGRDPADCSFIIDPNSCPNSMNDEVQSDVPTTVPATTGELRALATILEAKLTAARTSKALAARQLASARSRTSVLCQELARVVATVP